MTPLGGVPVGGKWCSSSHGDVRVCRDAAHHTPALRMTLELLLHSTLHICAAKLPSPPQGPEAGISCKHLLQGSFSKRSKVF